MKLVQNFLFFVSALILHLGLLHLFVLSFYTLYFVGLFASSYLLHGYNRYFSYIVFSIFLILILGLINLDIYDEYIFEVFLWFDVLDWNVEINSEVMYILMALHLLLLLNLKKFENFWDIIDKKICRT